MRTADNDTLAVRLEPGFNAARLICDFIHSSHVFGIKPPKTHPLYHAGQSHLLLAQNTRTHHSNAAKYPQVAFFRFSTCRRRLLEESEKRGLHTLFLIKFSFIHYYYIIFLLFPTQPFPPFQPFQLSLVCICGWRGKKRMPSPCGERMTSLAHCWALR